MKRNFGVGSYRGDDGYGPPPDGDLGHGAIYVIFALLIFVVWVGSRYL